MVVGAEKVMTEELFKTALYFQLPAKAGTSE
jgi:hypothetical protein